MNKLIGAYMLLFLLFSFFSSIAEGGGGVVATKLSSSLTKTTTTIPVSSTQGFLAADSIIIDDEEIAYNGILAGAFQNATRGYRGTEKATHKTNATVYSTGAGVLNRSLGFNVVSTGEAYGNLAVVNTTWTFLTKAVGYLVSFNFSILTGQMVYIRYLLMAPAVGLIVYLAVMAVGTLFGIISKVL